VAQRADVPADEKLHRFLVVNGALVSSLRCDPPRILGDGASTVGELIRRLNDDPRRSGLALRSIPVDAQLQARLGELGVDLDDVLPRGRHLILTGARTPERGAMPIDVTEGVHESVRDAVLRAAAGERGPIVGVDFLTADVRLSCQQGGGRVSGTTSAPELHPHALPEHGRVREFGDALLAVVIPGGATPTIPTAMLVGERRMRDVARGLDRFLRAAHEGVGSATRDGATIQGRPLERTARGQRSGPEFLLGDPRLTMLVSTISPRRIVERGLGLDRVRVVGLLDPASTPASDAYRACIGVCLAALPDVFVIGAGNAHLPQVLDALGPSRVLLVARRRDDPVAASHLAAGGAAVVPSDDGKSAELLRGADTIGSIPLGSLRASKAGRPGRRRSGGLHAAAMAWALGHGTGPAAGDPATAPGPAVADAPPVRTPAGGD
jgi:cyanophycin synthetase